MRKFIYLVPVVFYFSITAGYAQLSETQISNYINDARLQGKDPRQITTELGAMGVSSQQANAVAGNPQSLDDINNRLRTPTPESSFINSGLPQRRIFGHEIFNQTTLTFEPSMNIATPANYKLGPGDEVIIDVWGASQNTIRRIISPDGSIFVSGLGPVYLNGMTVNDANTYLQREFSRIYAGIDGEASQIKLTLGQIRTIQINVMGEARTPGTYSLSSFATAFHALYQAGGVNSIGTVRDIKVIRNSKEIASIDIYEYILHGKSSDFIRLHEGDVVLVPTYSTLVEISGNIKRPMYYEMKPGESLADIIEFAGGFTGDAYSKTVTVTRFNGEERQIFTVGMSDFTSFGLRNGDRISVASTLDTYENMASISGAVYRPGEYEINESVRTVAQLIEMAGGLRGDEFRNRILVSRQRDDRTRETIALDLSGILNGTSEDLQLRRNDNIYIPSIHDIEQDRSFIIYGEVANPGRYDYADGTTVEDLILRAGGLLESATVMKVDISRRIKDPKRTTENNTIGATYTVTVKDGFVIDGEIGFQLQPYDQVFVRRSPGYMPQRNVTVLGEVLYPGIHSLATKGARVSELVALSGGLTSDAFPEGARLIRTMNDEELRRRQDAVRMSHIGGQDSVAISTLDLKTTFNVGIELDKAILFPMSDYDLVLREGDLLIIPEYINTVKINGEVLYSNTVIFQDRQKLKYYINQAGGYTSKAKKKKTYVLHLNGTVSKYKNRKTITPGSEIIVPSKRDRNHISWREVMSIGTTAASVGTMGAAIANIAK